MTATTAPAAYDALCAHLRETAALARVSGLLSWDQEAVMPPRGAAARAEQSAAMARVLHGRNTDPRIADWLSRIDADDLDDAGRANLREAGKAHDRATRVPADLTAEIARATSAAHGTWAQARAEGTFSDFAPTLANVIALTREKAACLKTDGQSDYDALIEDFEPGTGEYEIAAVFGRLRDGLTDLRKRIAEKAGDEPLLRGTFPAAAQMTLARELASVFGYDWQAGRLDLVVHPFCSGSHGDVRITTRVDTADPLNCLYSTIHETGHALYEQGLDPALEGQPAGGHVSMGVHESQSRMCENQIGRSAAFMEVLFPRMTARFGDIGPDGPGALYRAVNRVVPGHIRTEADEVHYNLHIMLRFELERSLISGDLVVGDLEAAWNDRFAADFGMVVETPAQGVLQDVHWSAGLFGYFPTYALGNLYAAELFAAMRRAHPDADDRIARGDLGALTGWLRTHVHRIGARFAPQEVISRACGQAPTEAALLSYLEEKFTGLYDL